MTTLPRQFEEYLKTEVKISGKTLRNYRSDIGHFLAWSNHAEDIVPHFTGLLVANYKSHHIENKIPEGTTNRRLSTLRNFGKFLVKAGLITENPTQLLNNLSRIETVEQTQRSILEEFEAHLREESVSKATLKNYMSDVRQFLAWIPGNQTLSTKL